MLPHDAERLDAVGDAVPAGGIHVHRRDTVLMLLHRPVLEHERGDAALLQPSRDVDRLEVDRQRDERSSGGDDDTRARGRTLRWEIRRQRRCDDVLDDGADRRVPERALMLRPPLGARCDAGPESHRLRVQ